jgi:hypothetical protein
MHKAARLLILAALVAPLRADATGSERCSDAARAYARLADLPPGAVAALGFAIAERDAPWNATDVLHPGLPRARFISARGGGCTLTIRYEHGGIAHSYESATLALRGGRWTLQDRR